MNPIISYTNKLPGEVALFNLFETTGWNEGYQLLSSDLIMAVKKSWYCFSAYHMDTLVGFGRIICDGIVHALILDLIVHPQYMGNGIGGEILENLVQKCKQHNIRDIQLFRAKGKASFYEKRGFVLRKDDAPGMEFKFAL